MTFDPMSVEVTCVTLPKDHCVQVPWQYINVCGYSDQFCKIPHTYTYIHTHTYIHTTYRMSDHIVSYWTQFRQDKNRGSFGDRSKIMGFFSESDKTSSWPQSINPLKSWLQLLWQIKVLAKQLKWWVLGWQIRNWGSSLPLAALMMVFVQLRKRHLSQSDNQVTSSVLSISW